ncbi:polymorphic toxin-type HINT domain-containing protein [Catellatospora sp. KI3]|uniref:polymorphic toxin-type HINT domain-containing protein n=1 Tax=Catellatospora sp. KI3 TaxID=3041620 RepID=UPI002482EE69|nr:polymorphic toxin-type HINT domain-containing protein [Catellatospora sp. KI3]MDI1462183.1 polymorphic toxin-type HINT domain-containing protein [Catellatospora sp. KI3]
MSALLAVPPAHAAVTTPSGRAQVLAVWKTGGPEVRRAAEQALAGSDQDIAAFLSTGHVAATEQDLRAQLEQLLAVSGPGVRSAGMRALAGSSADVTAFLDHGYKKPFEDDQRVRLSQIMSAGGPGVRAAAATAMNGSIDKVIAFVRDGQYAARNDDDRVRLTQLMATGGPEVKAAAAAALNGTVGDVRQFLATGWQVAAARDEETLTVAQLADLSLNASQRAGEQSQAAKDASARAIDAARLAKEAAQRAAAETQAAQGAAGKAAVAAGRAADAAGRAADAARTASSAAAAANAAARQAADAAAAAAAASALAGDAAARARAAAAGAATDAAKADAARAAAVLARKAAADSRSAGEAAAWAGRAASESAAAAQAAASAGANAAAAAQAATDAAGYSGVSAEQAEVARRAAAKAKAAAEEAIRAANATSAIAGQAAAAAGDAQRAANQAAAHAEAAAAAAEAAAAHAGEAATAASTSQAAATEAAAAADTAQEAATQAHRVAQISRDSDAERLAAQQATAVAEAVEAARAEDEARKTAAWQAGQAVQYGQEAERLLTEATAPGVDPATAVTKGRQAAVRLLTAGGPWIRSAAESALAGGDPEMLGFLSSGLATARERDDRASVMAIAHQATKLEQRLAAETASVGTVEQVREFLATGAYPGKDDDDRILLSQIMAAGGPGVQAGASQALNGTIEQVREFLATGQYLARESDNRVLVTQNLATGGPEVRAVAQAVLSGPASGLVPFLQTGLPKAQQRDADATAHNATIDSYLAAIDGNVATARQYAAEAAQAAATARGAAAEAAGYANQAQASAAQANAFAVQAAASAAAAKASAAQAASYAQQAQANAASAAAAAQRAALAATAAAASAQQAAAYAAEAQAAADAAAASALAAGDSADEAAAAATEAGYAAWRLQLQEQLEGVVQTETVFVGEDGRVSFVEAVPQPNTKQEIIREDISKCVEEDPGTATGWFTADDTWHKNKAGVEVCDVPVTVKVTGDIDYVMKTCPVPNLSITACHGQYTSTDTLLLSSKPLDNPQYDTTAELTYTEYSQHYKVYCDKDGGCATGDSAKLLFHILTDDFVKCFNNPGLNGPCAWAALTVIPTTTLIKGVKYVTALRWALLTGVAVTDARLALDTTLLVYTTASMNRLDSLIGAVARFRATLKDGAGLEAALAALRREASADRALVKQLETEANIANEVRTTCVDNSFPAGTLVTMADGSRRTIETVGVGDRLLSRDPQTGAVTAQSVTDTFQHATTRLLDVDIDGVGTITSTPGHRLYVDGVGWQTVAQLRAGDVLVGRYGIRHEVAGVRPRPTSVAEKVFDLTVDGPHTFLVSRETQSDVLVHNCLNLLKDHRDFPLEAHTIREHVAEGPYGTNGALLGVDQAAAETLAKAKGINGVFTDLSVAQEALKKAFQARLSAMATWKNGSKADIEFDVTVEVLDANGVKLTSLGKVYEWDGATMKISDASTRVRVVIVRDYRDPKGWFVKTMFPLPRN